MRLSRPARVGSHVRELWREGLMDVVIGVAGLAPLEDYRGFTDRRGRQLSATIIAVADQLAAALTQGRSGRTAGPVRQPAQRRHLGPHLR
jgi:F420-0:gamma-glutamyl ligase